MRSGHAAEFSLPVIAAGVGVRRGSGWAVRSASFRLGPPGYAPALAAAALGIATLDPDRPGIGPGRHSAPYRAARERSADDASQALTAVIAGRIAPGYGSLIVLGEDMSAPESRAAVRRQVGVASPRGLAFPAARVRGLVERAASRARQAGRDRYLLVAAILDRLGLTPWSEVPLRAAPPLVERKARLAAAMVHQPRLLLLDGMLDNLSQPYQFALGQVIADLARDTPVIAAGRYAGPLLLACAHVLTLTDGVLVGQRAGPASHFEPEPVPDPEVAVYFA